MDLTSSSSQQSSNVGDQDVRPDRSIAGGKENPRPAVSLNPRDLREHLAEDWAWRNLVAKLLVEQGEIVQANDFLWCESNFIGVMVCEADLLHSKAISKTCHLRYCPHCARRDAARLVHTYTPQVMEVVHSSPIKEYRLREIVLTMNVDLYQDDIRAQVAEAHKAVAAVFDHFLGAKFTASNRGRWSEPASKYYTGEGYVYSMEFGENGHKLHFHVLYFGRWIGKYDLSEYWQQLTGNKITWIEHVSKTERAVAESLKYIAKVSKSFPDPETGEIVDRLPPPQFIARLAYVLKGTRRIISRGCFRGFEQDITEPGEDLGENTCSVCGAHADLVSPLAWSTIHYAAYQRLLDLIPGNNFAKVDETAQVANSPPKPVFGKLLSEQAVEDQAAILRSKRTFQDDDLFKVTR